jgi:hypothetical protein
MIIKKLFLFFTLMCLSFIISGQYLSGSLTSLIYNHDIAVYQVYLLKKPLKIDGNWNKKQWKETASIEIKYIMGEKPVFFPATEAKVRYDQENIYVIFRVKDQFVKCEVKDYNGPVYKDSCVEFFFSPDQANPLNYFNVEINCGGTILTHYVNGATKKHTLLEVEDLKKIEIAHTLPKVIENEITKPITWYIEYKIPLAVLEKYANVSRPQSGVVWKANFFKTASTTSNPHYLTWSYVNHPKPNFHLPEYFGTLVFH